MDKSLEIEIEGHRLTAVLTHSDNSGIPVFFLHGITGSPYFWTPELTSPFQHLGSCYSLSLPGHFPAVLPRGFPAACLTPELIARLIAGAIQKTVGNRKVLLVGHSTGGFAALSTAIYYPEAVAGIISIAGFCRGQWTGALGLMQWLVRQGSIGRAVFKKTYRLGGVNRAIFRMFWHVYVNDHMALSRHPGFATVVNTTFPGLQKLDLDAMLSYFTVMPQIDITPCLSKITIPTCLIAGDKDPIVPPKQSAIMAEKITTARRVVVKGAGHLTFFERPMEYRRAIDSWLTEFQPLYSNYPFNISS
ncbi:MAG: alpha/beta hydrolase [Chloroflexi bacterium]|nr:MAG: alpha/beta hydrolase [Chloroflexota bacterium]